MKNILLGWTIWLVLIGFCQASPLQNFSQSAAALEMNWRPNWELRHTQSHSTPASTEFSLTHGLGNKTAVAFRQTRYDSYDNIKAKSLNEELNIIYKCNDNIQLYAGYSGTSVKEDEIGLRLHKNVLQFGLIGIKPLNEKSTIYAIAGGGNNLFNIELGWSYLLRPGIELNATYRHLSAEKIGPEHVKSHVRGVGLGITYKF